MLRLRLFALVTFAASACAEAGACTLLPSLYKSGSPEAIAEEIQSNKRLAVGIADTAQLVFVGKTVRERLPEISEITAGVIGRWDDIPGVRS